MVNKKSYGPASRFIAPIEERECNEAGWIVQATETAQVEVVNVGDPGILLTPTDTGTAEIIQRVSVTPGTSYRLSFTLSSSSDSYAYAGVRGHAGKWSELSTGENKAGRYTLEFETSSDVSEVTIFAQAYRQQTAPVHIDDIQLALADSHRFRQSQSHQLQHLQSYLQSYLQNYLQNYQLKHLLPSQATRC